MQRMHCVQLPEIAILGVGILGDDPAVYLVHAQHMFSCLLQKQSRQTASSAMRDSRVGRMVECIALQPLGCSHTVALKLNGDTHG